MMEQSIQKLRQEKQGYICENIDPNYYEEFHEFCLIQAGDINIDNWSIKYVQDLVTKFLEDLRKNRQTQQQHERSFAIYQTTNGDDQRNRQQKQKKQHNNSPTHQQKQPKQTVVVKKQSPIASTSPQKKESSPFVKNNNDNHKFSALELLDSAFQQGKKKIDENTFKTGNSYFDSESFWDAPKIDPKTLPKQNTIKESSPQQFKSIKLNLNVSQLIQMNKNPSKSLKVQQSHSTLNKTLQVQQSPVNELRLQKIQNIDAFRKSPQTERSEFDTFSILAQKQIQKKRSSTIYGNWQEESPQNRQKSITIQPKEIKPKHSKSIVSTPKQPYKGPKVFKNDFNQLVTCVKAPLRSNFGGEGLKAIIEGFQIIERSIFSSNYLMYKVKIMPFGTVSNRNYADFWKLKTTLQKFYPAIQMPYLQKEGWISETSQEYARKQSQMLEQFMSDIIANNQLRNSRITEQFLTISEHKKMKRKFEDYDQMLKLKSIQELCLLQGKVQVSLTEKQRIYNENMGKFQGKVQANIQKYKKCCENLSLNYQQTMQTISSIQDIITELDKDIRQFNRNVTTKELQILGSSFNNIKTHFQQSHGRVKFQKKVIQQIILPFLRYEKLNIQSAKGILETCQSMTSRYLKRAETEGKVSESYGSAKEHKQGILQQSKSLVVFKYQAGYLQAQAASQMHRIMQRLGFKVDQLWQGISHEYVKEFQKSLAAWRSLN